MAGGSGTRFWPASRRARPKQLLPLIGGTSLIGATVDRAATVVGTSRTWIVTHPTMARSLPDVLPGFPVEQVIVEPEPRDTAPCAALATARIEAQDPGATMAFLPADHVIEPADVFGQLLRRGAELAADGSSLVTFGIRPTHPATGYGYVEQGSPADDAQPPAFRVLRFREKPDPATAAEFLRSGAFLWNSGMFVWTARALLDAMRAGDPDLAECTGRMLEAARSGAEGDVLREFGKAPKTSVDYAVMEKAPRVLVVHADLDWNDLGSFTSLGAVSPVDERGNVTSLHAGARAVLEQSANCVVYGEGARTVALFGVSDLVVVAVGDAVLVCTKDRAEELKTLVGRLAANGMEDLL